MSTIKSHVTHRTPKYRPFTRLTASAIALAVLISPLELPILNFVSEPEDFFVEPTFSAKDVYEDSPLQPTTKNDVVATFSKGAPLPQEYSVPELHLPAAPPVADAFVPESIVALQPAIEAVPTVAPSLKKTPRSVRHYENALAATAVAQGNSASELTSVTLDSDGNIIATADVHGANKTAQYDEAGRPIRITNADGSESYYSYNAQGQVTSISRTEAKPAQGPVATLFSKIAAPLWALAGDEDTVSYDYQNGDITDVRDGESGLRYEYDEEGLVTAEYRADGSGIEYSYDELGNVVSSEEFESNNKELSLASFLRLSYASPLSIFVAEESSYNDNNKLAEYKILKIEETPEEIAPVSTSSTLTATSTPELAIPLATTTEATSTVDVDPVVVDPIALPLVPTVIEEVITETTEVVASLFARTSANLALWFDRSLSRAFAQVQSLTADNPASVASSTPLYSISYTYDAQGNIVESRSSAGVITTYSYDAQTDSLLAKTVTSPTGETSTINYQIGADARITSTDGVGYQFSASGMLTQAGNTSYTYDDSGNRIQSAGTVYTYSGNRLLDVTYEDGRVTSYSYDERGAVTTISDTQKGSTAFTYNNDGSIETIEKAGVKISYTYDALGRRATRASSIDGAWQYEYNGQLLKRVKNSEGLVLREYFYTPTNELTAIRSDETLYQVVVGNNKSVTGLVDVKTGAMYAQSYDAWGAVVTSDFPVALDIGYIGAFAEASLGLSVFGPRAYDPELGRFLSKDPLPGVLIDNLSQNEYIYAKNDPIHQYDPSGHASELADKSDSPKRALVETNLALEGFKLELKGTDDVLAKTVLEATIVSLEEVKSAQEAQIAENEAEVLLETYAEAQTPVTSIISTSEVPLATSTASTSEVIKEEVVSTIPVFDLVIPQMIEQESLPSIETDLPTTTEVSFISTASILAFAGAVLDKHLLKAEAKKKSKSKKKSKKKVSKKAKVKQDKKAKQLANMRKQLNSLQSQLSAMKVKVDAKVQQQKNQLASTAVRNLEATTAASAARLNAAPAKPAPVASGNPCGVLMSCAPISAGITSPSVLYTPTQSKTISQYFTATNAHYALTACGFEQTLIGAGCGLLDGILYATEGNWTDAALSGAATIPFIGATGDYAKAAKLATDAALSAKAIKVVVVSDLPQHVQSSLSKYKQYGWSTYGRADGTAVGKGWRNLDKNGNPLLPTNTSYKEYDVNDKIPGLDRDKERFLKADDGSVYYTNNHYGDFSNGFSAFYKIQ